jgi:hypothetical protein
MAWFRQIARAPVPTGARCIDEDPGVGVGVQRAHEVIDLGLPGAEGAEVDHLSVVSVGDIRHGDELLMPIPSARQCARVTQGRPPSSSACVRMLWLWLQASSPTIEPEVSLPLGSHDV